METTIQNDYIKHLIKLQNYFYNINNIKMYNKVTNELNKLNNNKK